MSASIAHAITKHLLKKAELRKQAEPLPTQPVSKGKVGRGPVDYHGGDEATYTGVADIRKKTAAEEIADDVNFDKLIEKKKVLEGKLYKLEHGDKPPAQIQIKNLKKEINRVNENISKRTPYDPTDEASPLDPVYMDSPRLVDDPTFQEELADAAFAGKPVGPFTGEKKRGGELARKRKAEEDELDFEGRKFDKELDRIEDIRAQEIVDDPLFPNPQHPKSITRQAIRSVGVEDNVNKYIQTVVDQFENTFDMSSLRKAKLDPTRPKSKTALRTKGQTASILWDIWDGFSKTAAIARNPNKSKKQRRQALETIKNISKWLKSGITKEQRSLYPRTYQAKGGKIYRADPAKINWRGREGTRNPAELSTQALKTRMMDRDKWQGTPRRNDFSLLERLEGNIEQYDPDLESLAFTGRSDPNELGPKTRGPALLDYLRRRESGFDPSQVQKPPGIKYTDEPTRRFSNNELLNAIFREMGRKGMID